MIDRPHEQYLMLDILKRETPMMLPNSMLHLIMALRT